MIGTEQVVQLVLAGFCVFLNAWFVLAEFALVKVRATRLRELEERGDRRARRTLAVVGELDKYLNAIQLGITLASLGLGWLGEPAVATLIAPLFESLPASAVFSHGVAATVAFLLITYLHVVLGEMAPKTMAIQRAEPFALHVSGPLKLFYALSYPLILLLQHSSNRFVRIIGFRPASDAVEAHTERELRFMVAASHRHGIIDEDTRTLIESVFEYSEHVVREIMTPRPDVVVLHNEDPVEDSVRTAMESEYTRFPLLERDRVLGFVHLKDLTGIAAETKRVETLRDIVREPLYVPETVTIDRIRHQFQRKRTHFGIVVDEYGDFVGVVTLEDILEELVGDIQDELDVESPKINRLADGCVEAEGDLPLDDAEDKLELVPDEEVEGVDTLGGLVATYLGRTAKPGDHITIGGYDVEVLQVEGLRIRRLRLEASTRPTQPGLAGDEEPEQSSGQPA